MPSCSLLHDGHVAESSIGLTPADKLVPRDRGSKYLVPCAVVLRRGPAVAGFWLVVTPGVIALAVTGEQSTS